LQKSEVERIINDLSSQRLIVKTEKKGSFGNKKVEVKVNGTSITLLNVKRKESEQKMQQMQQWYDNGNSTQLQNYMKTNRMWIPMMLFSGIMNMIFFFTSMMSFMGMGMSPLESAMIGNNADTATGGEVQSTDNANNNPRAD
jgi:hypothetical protein